MCWAVKTQWVRQERQGNCVLLTLMTRYFIFLFFNLFLSCHCYFPLIMVEGRRNTCWWLNGSTDSTGSARMKRGRRKKEGNLFCAPNNNSSSSYQSSNITADSHVPGHLASISDAIVSIAADTAASVRPSVRHSVPTECNWKPFFAERTAEKEEKVNWVSALLTRLVSHQHKSQSMSQRKGRRRRWKNIQPLRMWKTSTI